MKVTVFWDMTSRTLAGIYQHFKENLVPLFSGWWGGGWGGEVHAVPRKQWYMCTKPRGIIPDRHCH